MDCGHDTGRRGAFEVGLSRGSERRVRLSTSSASLVVGVRVCAELQTSREPTWVGAQAAAAAVWRTHSGAGLDQTSVFG